MAVPSFIPKNPFQLLGEELEEKAAATETRRHGPMLAAMQALAKENEMLKKQVAELLKVIADMRLGAGRIEGPEKGAIADDEVKKMFDDMMAKKALLPPSLMPVVEPRPLTAAAVFDPSTMITVPSGGIMGKTADFIFVDDLGGMDVVERAKPREESAKGFEWEGAWDEELLPADRRV